MRKKINIKSWIVSAIVAIVFITTITIWSELFKPIKNWLAETFSHHWVGKGVVSVILFIVVGFLLHGVFKKNDNGIKFWLYVLFWVTLLGTVAITGFYIYEAFFVSH